MQEKTYWLAFDSLNGVGLGYKRIWSLFEHFGSLEKAWQADKLDLQAIKSLPSAVIDKFLQVRQTISLEKPLANLEKYNVQAVTQLEPEYPVQLKALVQPPLIIYTKGKLNLNWFDKALAVVGTRHASNYALEQTEIISASLASAGFTIISGLALGIDSAAHKGALKMPGGRTVAVLANGPEQIVPSSTKAIYRQIEETGFILSEYPPQTLPEKGYFPARNRLVAALSQAVLVSEAADKSGALITANRALELNKPVFGLTGIAGNNQGVHHWIRKGKAKLITCAEDILEELNIFTPIQVNLSLPQWQPEKTTIKSKPKSILPELKPEEKIIYEQLLQDEFIGIDEITEKSQLPIAKVNSVLLTLQIKKLIKKDFSGAVSRV